MCSRSAHRTRWSASAIATQIDTGAAIATLITEAVRMALALTFVGQEGFGLRWFTRFWRSTLAAMAMAAALLLIRLDLWAAILLGGLVYCLALTAVGGIRLRRGAFPALSV